jgi:hypothetical protein
LKNRLMIFSKIIVISFIVKTKRLKDQKIFPIFAVPLYFDFCIS